MIMKRVLIFIVGLAMMLFSSCSQSPGSGTNKSTGTAGKKDNAIKGREQISGTRILKVDKRYLIFPCSKGLKGDDSVFVMIDNKMYMSAYNALIARSDPDFWTFLDLSNYHGKEVSVAIKGPDVGGIELVKMSDTIPGRYPLYLEPGRPMIHFSPVRGWLNDPSGMIYFEGKWNLYYANTRFSNVMAGPNNAWGHATSTDLLHWEEQPLFLTPVREECSFWTGGAAVDVANTTGMGRPGKPALVFSANNGSDAPNAFTQCIFVSTDGGMTVLRNPEMMYKPLPPEDSRRGGGTRDPMILWYAPEKKWVMVVYNQPPGGINGFYFFESYDLRNWKEMSVLEDFWECPNLFPLPVDGNKADMRWVIWGSNTEYLIGKFNGRAFIPDGDHKFHTFNGMYSASQVFANAPGGRIIQIGWAHVCDYDMEFSQMASFPLELSLRTTSKGISLFSEFIPELSNLRMDGLSKKNLILKAGEPFRIGNVSQPMEILLEFQPGRISGISLNGAELSISWNAMSQELDVLSTKVKLKPENGLVQLHILLDISSVEVTTNRGENYIIKGRNFLNLPSRSPLEIRADGGDVKIQLMEIYPLKSIHTS